LSNNGQLVNILNEFKNLLLPWEKIQSYLPVALGNARLRKLFKSTVGKGLWQLLWIPPSLSYYQLDKLFRDKNQLTKQLIFSAWRVVPKTVATLLSYEVERKIFPPYRKEMQYDSYSEFGTLLNLQKRGERLTGMPVLGIMYPSMVLAEKCDPYLIRNENGFLEIPALLKIVEQIIQDLLNDLPQRIVDQATDIDEAWYWAAPILLDLQYKRQWAKEWLTQENLALIWTGREDLEETYWSDHVNRAKQLMEKGSLGRPPADLAAVLAEMALGGPAICALRSLSRVIKGKSDVKNLPIRNAAAQIAWGFRSFFNRPESIAIIRGMNASEPYWQRLLEYSISGGIQAVLDEYAHILRES
ncbi:DEAD/DEAH box helicase, partial [bacterium]|nr:DEAD/DEAH box helicase [bacterium]